MTFQVGNQLHKMGKPGRKGYTIEQAQLDKMRRLLDRDLKIAEELQKSKEIDATSEKKLSILQSRILKYSDKLHASKSDLTTDGKAIVINIVREIAEQNDIK